MIKTYKLEFCNLEVHNEYTINVVNEGVLMSHENLNILLELMDTCYGNKPFVYISHRIHSFAVDPAIHLQSTKIPNLVGFAIVSDNPYQKMQIKIEETFFGKKFKQFDTMEEALEWKDEILKNQIG